MEKYVAVVFDTEAQAFEGAEALRSLHRNGDVTVYSAAILAKTADGRIEIRNARDEGPIGTALGLAVGGLVGLLAGPAAVASGAAAAGTAAAAQAAAGGMVAGSATGGFVGLFRDAWSYDLEDIVFDKVTAEMVRGEVCLVASVEELWTAPLNNKMEALGGVVFRKSRIALEDETVAADLQAFDDEIYQLEADLAQAHEDNKAAIREKIEAAKARHAARKTRIEQKANVTREVLNA